MPTSLLNATSTHNTSLPADILLGPPPTNRTLIEQMDIQVTDDGILPECYKLCMKSENGKANINITTLTIEGWCYEGVDFVNSQTWLNTYVLPCVKYECADNMKGKASRARAWMRDTCGPWDGEKHALKRSKTKSERSTKRSRHLAMGMTMTDVAQMN
ncbi:hypothetical protein MCOR25_008891 [Pyricularia grisea]|uniref:Uncharacterized protein n=1 Tax=Pyricularia grisea TaxID=148305 RepID=A0A6P8BHM9_PYRGI|nr:uncharacterized protein PgNI_01391 [Pyricularia grisea]KAI6353748.1 hypothetical protein MCOR25_008891 [Pyricularia grisea]TLD16386.1 hypothetical protein PgNI_01391 [Pyricularia grisea]